MTITIELDDQVYEQLTKSAQDQGHTVEEYLQHLASDSLQREVAFDSTMQYVLKKNEELYRRLAK